MQSSRTGVWRKGALQGSTTQEKFYNSYYYLGLKTDTIFPALKLTQYCYIYIIVFFLENWQFKGLRTIESFHSLHQIDASRWWVGLAL